MTLSEVKQGDMIAIEGAHADSMFILLKGSVEISKRIILPLWGEETTKQEKSLVRLSEKDHAFFGEMALFEDQSERSASITALQPCTLAVLEKKELLKTLDRKSEIGSVVFKYIATERTRRLIKSHKEILILTTSFCLALESE